MVLSTSSTILSSYYYATSTTERQKIHAMCLQGRDTHGIAAIEAGLFHNAISFAGKLGLRIPLLGRVALYTFPFLLANRIAAGIKNPTLRASALFIQRQVPNFCLTALVTTSVALIVLGNPLSGGALIASLIFNDLKDKNILHSTIVKYLNDYSLAVCLVSALATNNYLIILDTVLSPLISILVKLIKKHLDKTAPKEKPLPDVDSGALTTESLKKILHIEQPITLKVNREHICYKSLPHFPDNELSLEDLFNQVEWHNPDVMNSLKAAIADEDKFKEEDYDVELLENPQFCIDYAKTGLNNLLEKSSESPKLQMYLQIIKNGILSLSSDQLPHALKVQHLISLFVEAGDPCPIAAENVAETVTDKLFLKGNSSLKSKIFFLLQNERNRWAEITYYTTMQKYDPNGYIQKNNIHIRNFFYNGFFRAIGLHKHSIVVDTMIREVSPLLELIGKVMFTRLNLERKFWKEDYSPTRIQAVIQEAIKERNLTQQQITDWWLEWIDKQEIRDDEKEQLILDLSNNTLFGKQMTLQNGDYHPEIIEAMLFEMGILTEDNEPAQGN